MRHCCQRCGEPAGIGKHCRHTLVCVPPAAVRLIPLQPVKPVFSAASLLLSDGHRKKKCSDLTPDLCCTILSFLSDFRIPVSDRFCQICFCCSLSLLVYHIPSCAALCLKQKQSRSKVAVSPDFPHSYEKHDKISSPKHLSQNGFTDAVSLVQTQKSEAVCRSVSKSMQKRQTKWQFPYLAQFGSPVVQSRLKHLYIYYNIVFAICQPFSAQKPAKMQIVNTLTALYLFQKYCYKKCTEFSFSPVSRQIQDFC